MIPRRFPYISQCPDFLQIPIFIRRNNTERYSRSLGTNLRCDENPWVTFQDKTTDSITFLLGAADLLGIGIGLGIRNRMSFLVLFFMMQGSDILEMTEMYLPCADGNERTLSDHNRKLT